MFILKHRFQDIGCGKIERQEWFLEDQDTGRAVDFSRPWSSIMKPGRVLNMSMVFKQRSSQPAQQCPSCQFTNPGRTTDEITCSSCRLTYRRAEEVQDIEVQKDDVTTSPIATSGRRRNASIRNKGTPESRYLAVPRPRPPSTPKPADEEIGSYKRV
ncbi:hypothetical protein B0T24DRAFT_620553 [Lasiosphaeria ovina]|uniref:GATA-type domain-containing protein n=1 Tax=Lasiosphaeria ovina TaxID=92902 RepID=A0AAE0KIJ5_9PEZI|nr:hypothetical protein B0T24DRAFT_620553 [Lasiosphaeria ovina]